MSFLLSVILSYIQTLPRVEPLLISLHLQSYITVGSCPHHWWRLSQQWPLLSSHLPNQSPHKSPSTSNRMQVTSCLSSAQNPPVPFPFHSVEHQSPLGSLTESHALILALALNPLQPHQAPCHSRKVPNTFSLQDFWFFCSLLYLPSQAPFYS